MAGTIVADTIQADSTSTLVLRNGVANTPPTIQDNNGTQIGTFCRAWVNFNGTGTVAIRASFNVSSITDGGVGLYTVNFTTAMPDANYARSVLTSCDGFNASAISDTGGLTYTASAMQFYVTGITGATNALFDPGRVSVAIFR
jgi:hypothetical protein